ncbi:MAG TPA: ABC-type transport auxiliary lipoprotein family protein [Steroidobacteraceae bacterium]
MKLAAVVALLLMSAACTGGLHSSVAASQVYVLRAAESAAVITQAVPAGATLQVARPSAAPGLESDRIVIVAPEHRMSYYAASQWAAALPVLVETVVVARLRSAGGWAAVNDSESAFQSEYYLQIGIRRFEAEYTTQALPTVRVSFDCAIGRRASRELVASFTVDGAAAASANRVGAVVSAFEQALNVALVQLAQHSAAAVRSSQARSPP